MGAGLKYYSGIIYIPIHRPEWCVSSMKCDQHELAAQPEPNRGRTVSIAAIEIDGISTLFGDVVPDDKQIETRFMIEIE